MEFTDVFALLQQTAVTLKNNKMLVFETSKALQKVV